MSVFSAMDTAVSGLTAQSVAFSNISNNIANSQTVGYKATDTSFQDFVEASGALEGQSGDVQATTQYQNQLSGSITSSAANGALAISGNGFFAVSEVTGANTTTAPTFSSTQYYTRAGDFSSDQNGYLVNSSNEYLDGYMVSPTTGQLNTSTLTQINVSNLTYRPTPTANVTASPTLPSGTTTTPETSSETVYDTNGTAQQLGFTWTQTAGATAASGTTAATGGTWTLSVSGTNTTPAPTASVVFNADGSLQSLTPAGGTAVTSGAASFNIGGVGSDSTNTIAVNLGTIGTTAGANATGTAFSAGTTTQDGTASGNYTGFTMEDDGSVMANFDNGQSQLVAKVPLAMFGDANSLQSQDGQAYTATVASGPASLQSAGENGAGNLETKSVEGSNEDLDTDLTKLIVAQQAYSASAKVVTTSNDMLQTALAMKQ